MTKRKIYESYTNYKGLYFKVFKQDGEFQVRFYTHLSTAPFEDLDYFTDDLQDAIQTGKAELKR